MKSSVNIIIIGVLTILLSLYGGGYLIHCTDKDSWFLFPNILVTVFMFFGGVIIFVVGLSARININEHN